MHRRDPSSHRARWLSVQLLALAMLATWAFALPSRCAEDTLATDYDEVRDVSLDLVERFSPEQYHYVFLGRSLTPVARFLTDLGVDNVSTIPITGLRAKRGFTGGRRTSAFTRTFHLHLDQYLPDLATLQGRTLMLVDYADTGATLHHARELFDGYVRERGLKGPVHTYGVVAHGTDRPTTPTRHTYRLGWLSRFAQHLDEHAYRPSAMYNSAEWWLLGDLRRQSPRNAYEQLGTRMRRHMASDAVLAKWRGARSGMIRR